MQCSDIAALLIITAAAAATAAASAAATAACFVPSSPPPLSPSSVQHPATRAQAEQTLLEFRRGAGVEACAALLQQYGDEGVRFQVCVLLLPAVCVCRGEVSMIRWWWRISGTIS